MTLGLTANQIAADGMPKKSGLHGYSETYTGNEEYISSTADDLKDLVGTIGKDRVSAEELSVLREFATEKFGPNIDLPTVLWQNGLLGYTDSIADKAVFFHSFVKGFCLEVMVVQATD